MKTAKLVIGAILILIAIYLLVTQTSTLQIIGGVIGIIGLIALVMSFKSKTKEMPMETPQEPVKTAEEKPIEIK